MSENKDTATQLEIAMGLSDAIDFIHSQREQIDSLKSRNAELKELLKIIGDVCSTQELPRRIRDLAHQARATLANEKEKEKRA